MSPHSPTTRTMPNPFIKTLIATDPLPPPSATLYEQIMAGNGLFLRAQRNQLNVLFPMSDAAHPNCPALTPSITLETPRIPEALIAAMMTEAKAAWRHPAGPLESLFHFTYNHAWQLDIPEQHRQYASVIPAHPSNCPSYNTCLVEIHSHHEMEARFSRADDKDETGFRIYGVCGNFAKDPHITFRVGLYGHYWAIPATLICELPTGLHDTYTHS